MGSTPPVGSSKKTIFGLWRRATEKATFCFHPKGREPTRELAMSCNPSSLIITWDFSLMSADDKPYIPPKKTIFSLVANIVKCDQKKRFHTTLTFKIRDVERTISEYFIKYESVEFSIYVPENMNILFREICHSPLVNPSFLNDWDILDIKDNRANITKIFSYKDNPDFIIFVREN